MSSAVAFSWGEMVSLENLVASGEVKLGRGKVISKIDIQNNPGPYPIYSSSSKNDGKMGEYGDYMFDEEMISWSVDGGGYFFHRPKHKFSVTNVSGYMRLNSDWDYKFTAYSFQFQHGYFSFDYQTKAHPSVIREFYFLPKIPVAEQQKIATILSSVDNVIEKTRAQIDKLKDLKTGMMQELLTKGIGHTKFKDSPVGRIPAAWEIARLGDIVLPKGIQTGPFGSQLHSHEYIEWGVPVIMPRDMKCNKIDPASVAHISLEKAAELDKHRVEIGDLVFARRGDIGRYALVDKSNEGWVCGTGCLKVRLKPSVSPSFIASYLTLTPVVEWLNTNSVGQTMLNLNTSILSDLPIILPPKHEQTVIGEAIVSLDNKVDLSSSKLDGLMRVKKALMQDLLTGKVRVNLNDSVAI